jgi:potassium efflux system protein
MHRFMKGVSLAIIALFLTIGGSSLFAQEQSAIRAKLDGLRLELDQIEIAVTTRLTSDSALLSSRKRIDQIAVDIKSVADEQTPRADAVRLRLKELGPRPDDKAPPESPEITKERDDREKSLKDVEETVKLARALLVQTDQLSTAISDKRRALFAGQLFTPSSSILLPALWADVAVNLGHDMQALFMVAEDTYSRAVERAGLLGGFLILFGLFLTAAATALARRKVLAAIERTTLFGNPTPMQKALRAVAFGGIGFLIPAAGTYAIGQAINGANILPSRVEKVLEIVLHATVFISVIRGLAEGLLATTKPEWRLLTMPNRTAAKLSGLASQVGVTIVAGRIFEGVTQAIVAGLALSVVSKSLFALLVASVLAAGLHSIKPEEQPASGNPNATPEPRPIWIVIARLLAWVIVLGILIATLLGYSAFAAFLSDQLASLTIIASLTFLAIQLTNAAFEQLLRPQTKLFRSIQSASGLSRQSLEQLAVILSGLTQLLILGLCATFTLAPWRVDSGDILMPLKAVIFGFSIGDVTISFGAALFSIALIGAGILFTRGIQRWLNHTYLPHTYLDSGLRNSIVTGIGYLGIIVSIAVGLSVLGLSLEKVTIVAGALSVGIGFGLQSVVNNFVSGLILLWERGIRVGDWIVVGEEQGLVKRINVRATEIETFDRSVLIVPNSSLVSGTVKNRVHNDRTGRVVVTIPTARDADPDLVIKLISEATTANTEILRETPPIILFRKLGETTKEFELTCFVGEVDQTAKVSSDLLLAIDRALRANGLGDIIPKSIMVADPSAVKHKMAPLPSTDIPV